MKSNVWVILAAIVLGAAIMFCAIELMKSGQDLTRNDGAPTPSGGQGASAGESPPTDASSTSNMKLIKGKRYRMMVVSARLPSRKPTGKAWDINSGLPDCFFLLRTGENRYKSSKVKDCLVPNWSDKSLSISDLWSGRVRVANEGAVFIYDPDSASPIQLDFSDTDLTMNDTIANLELAMDDLRAGYTEYKMSYSTNSVSVNTGQNSKAPDMLFTIRIIPDGR